MNGKNLSDSEFVVAYLEFEMSRIYFAAFVVLTLFMSLASLLSWKDELYWLTCVSTVIGGACILAAKIEKEEKKRYEEKLGMTKEKAKHYFDTIIQNEISFRILPLVRQVCMLNPEAKESQTQMMEGWYGMSRSSIKYVYEERCGNAENLRLAYKYLLKESLSYRKFFVEKLFKLAIVEDGIHNDEWNLLMDIMKQLKFNKNYFDFFIKRYGPLRTEFEADEQGEKQSTENIPVSQLKAYFAILGLEEGASDVEIKRAYHNLALQHHPDLPKNADRVEECETMMARINEAYEKIRN
jgi:DnaJ-domain-containing protein 1